MHIATIIGSRETPQEILDVMRDLILSFNENGTLIRSGGADGADHTVTQYAGSSNREIYLPWNGFNNLWKNKNDIFLWTDSPQHKEATKMALTVYHSINFARDSHRSFHSRNSMQVMGFNMDTPSDLIICWTPGGNTIGGTATAIKMAQAHNIPVYNLGDPVTLEFIKQGLYKEEQND